MNMFHTFQLPVGVKVVLGGEKIHGSLEALVGRRVDGNFWMHKDHNVSRILVAAGQHPVVLNKDLIGSRIRITITIVMITIIKHKQS